MGNNKASAALLAKIGQVAVAEFGRDDLYVAEAPPGLFLGESHLNVLQELEEDRLNDAGSVARIVEISAIVDTVQTDPRAFQGPIEAPAFLSDTFRLIVDNVDFAPAPLSEADRERYQRALTLLYNPPLEDKLPSPKYTEFCFLRSEIHKKNVARVQLHEQLERENQQERKAALEADIGTLSDLLREQQETVAEMDRTYGFTAAEVVAEDAERRLDQVPASVRRALNVLEVFEITDPISADTHVMCSFFPPNLSEDNWAPLKLTRKDIAEHRGDDGNSQYVDDIDYNSIESIEVETQTLLVDRSWFWPALFDNPRWRWRAPSKPVSTGKPEEANDCLIPAYVYALVFARNLTVRCSRAAERGRVRSPQPSQRPGLLTRALVSPVGSEPIWVSRPALKGAFSRAYQKIRSDQQKKTAKDIEIGPRRAHLAANVARGRVMSALRISTTHRDRGATGAAVRLLSRNKLRPVDLKNVRFTIRGQVVDSRAQPVFKAAVAVVAGEIHRKGITGRDGQFTVAGVPSGRHSIVISRGGFSSSRGSVTVPQSEPLTIRLQEQGNCEITVELFEHDASGAEVDFDGAAQIVIVSQAPRVETLAGRARTTLSLPPGDITLAIVSSEAERVTPPQIRLAARPGKKYAYRFEVAPAMALCNPNVQLLGFVCRVVPASPKA